MNGQTVVVRPPVSSPHWGFDIPPVPNKEEFNQAVLSQLPEICDAVLRSFGSTDPDVLELRESVAKNFVELLPVIESDDEENRVWAIIQFEFLVNNCREIRYHLDNPPTKSCERSK